MNNFSKTELLAHLKFISRIERGKQINVSEKVMQNPSLLTSFIRTFIRPDNKNNSRIFIENTVRQCISILKACAVSQNVEDRYRCVDIIRDIAACRNHGIVNIKYTYKDHAMFVCHIDTLLQEIDASLSSLKSEHPDLFRQAAASAEIDNDSIRIASNYEQQHQQSSQQQQPQQLHDQSSSSW